MGQLLSQGPLFLLCLIGMMSVVVIVHELGHYLAGRACGGAIRSFSFGFPVPLRRKRFADGTIGERQYLKPAIEIHDKRGTRWVVNWALFGGYVAFAGEEAASGNEQAAPGKLVGRAFPELSPLQRIVISLGGPIANFIFASAVFAIIIGTFGREVSTIGVTSVQPGMPAEAAGMQAGDAFVSANGKMISSLQDLRGAILLNPNTPVNFVVARGGEELPLIVTPVEQVRENDFGQQVKQATIGIGLGLVSVGEPVRYSPLQAAGQGVIETGRTIQMTGTMLSRIITGKMSIHTMSGPIGIGDVSRRVVNSVMDQEELTARQKFDALFWTLISLAAAISVGVGFFNLLPLPTLDGAAVAFHAYEWMAGKPLPVSVQALTLNLGLFMLLALVAFISFGDVIETGVFGRGGS